MPEPSTDELNQIAYQVVADIRRADEAEQRGDSATAREIVGRALALLIRTMERSPETFADGQAIRAKVLARLDRLNDTVFEA
jgi:hypothetical protein